MRLESHALFPFRCRRSGRRADVVGAVNPIGAAVLERSQGGLQDRVARKRVERRRRSVREADEPPHGGLGVGVMVGVGAGRMATIGVPNGACVDRPMTLTEVGAP